MIKLKERPEEIEAIQWTGTKESFEEIDNWIGVTVIEKCHQLKVRIGMCSHLVELNWWIIKNQFGDINFATPEDLEKRFEVIR